ncbi:PREDICTED: uncharacterized protein LOC109337009 [Lupinus angustifolius]|uniref:uncharacterized protein LOC109337009 n=1 Tax=Lupinus angustifolius TaxID=3871 RepID=UPI00092E48A9|nr:PREDICTED: uncharacterized protein LOC109337009 [Lupinus angustifolius]
MEQSGACGILERYWVTGLYAHNQLEKRKLLWKDIAQLSQGLSGPWITIGDFNNVLSTKDRCGGARVQLHEYEDLENMMQIVGLFEADMHGPHFTWSNKHTTEGIIYSRIDRAICNVAWFLNCLSKHEEFIPYVKDNWEQPITDPDSKAQTQLQNDQFNSNLLMEVKTCTENLLDLHKTEEEVMKQKSKINWLQLGDGNNAFFHATVKDKSKNKSIYTLTKSDGTSVSTQEGIMQEVLSFYTNLVGTTTTHRKSVNLIALRRSPCFSRDMAFNLIQRVTKEEVWIALQGIGESKAPGIDGYNSHFFKTAWDIVKDDVWKAVDEFFKWKRLYPAIKCTLVTMLPKTNDATTMKDMRPISCCTTIYKVISKILTTRLGRVINHVVDESQSAFVPGKVIHDNILLAQELVRGYMRKGISPRCMLQMDIQKAYYTVEWDALESIMIELGFPHQGDLISVKLLMQKFNQFSESTGLKASPTKFKVYFGGIDLQLRKAIQHTKWFTAGTPPFKYHGVPLDSRKLTVNFCSPLIEKITAKLKHWSTRLLSYADLRTYRVGSNCSRILKSILKHMTDIMQSLSWFEATVNGKFSTKRMYMELRGPKQQGVTANQNAYFQAIVGFEKIGLKKLKEHCPNIRDSLLCKWSLNNGIVQRTKTVTSGIFCLYISHCQWKWNWNCGQLLHSNLVHHRKRSSILRNVQTSKQQSSRL